MAIYSTLALKDGKKSAGSGFTGSLIGTAAGTAVVALLDLQYFQYSVWQAVLPRHF